MIDFTNCEVNRFKAYGGANGNKINIRYNDGSYMLKFPPKPSMNKEMSYTNGCISEYLACHIFESLGFRTQETLLGTYKSKKGKKKEVVACRDFTDDGKKLIEFAELKNTCIDSELNGYGTELHSILDAINEQTLLPPGELRAFFWDMFIADAFLGNFDRHNGNWGVLVDETQKTAEIAPIYDCGSCLYPQLAAKDMERVINNDDEISQRVFVFPTSAIQKNGKKISYFDFISSLKEPGCNAALKRIFNKINMGRIFDIIDRTPGLLPVQREFYKIMLKKRHERILAFSLDKLMKKERAEKNPER